MYINLRARTYVAQSLGRLVKVKESENFSILQSACFYIKKIPYLGHTSENYILIENLWRDVQLTFTYNPIHT